MCQCVGLGPGSSGEQGNIQGRLWAQGGLTAVCLLLDEAVSPSSYLLGLRYPLQAGGHGWGWVSRLISQREDSKMVLASSSVQVVEQVPQNGCLHCLCPQGELQLPLASLGDLPRSVGRSDPGFFQITASALGPIAYEILCSPFKSGVSVSYSPLALPKVSPLAFKAKSSGGLSS